MPNHVRSKCRRFVLSVFLMVIVAAAPTKIAHAASYLATGHWDFDQGDLRATLGTDLQYGDAPGETAMRDHTSFGTTIVWHTGHRRPASQGDEVYPR